jgi:hypothetical protein
MSFFQNPFAEDFYSSYTGVGEKTIFKRFKCPANAGRSANTVVAWRVGPYDLSGVDADGDSCATLRITFSVDPERHFYSTISIDVTTEATSSSAVTRNEIAAALNDSATFTDWFVAAVNGEGELTISKKTSFTNLRFYIVNGRAEEKIGFNLRSGVAQLPAYLDRHKVYHLLSATERTDWTDNANILIPLAPGTSDVDAAVINDAKDGYGNSQGHTAGTVLADWELLDGESENFLFKKQTVDATSRVTEIIEYAAGSDVGDMAKKTTMTYTDTKTEPDKILEQPHVIVSDDLVTP